MTDILGLGDGLDWGGDGAGVGMGEGRISVLERGKNRILRPDASLSMTCG